MPVNEACGWDASELKCVISWMVQMNTCVTVHLASAFSTSTGAHSPEPPLMKTRRLVMRTSSLVERPPGPVMNVDIWACPDCGTVAAFEGKVLAGDSDNLYVPNPDLSILEVHPQIDAKRILWPKTSRFSNMAPSTWHL